MKAGRTTFNSIRSRLTDTDTGVDSWQAEAFGLLVAERFYPDLVSHCQEMKSHAYGFFRRRLNLIWSVLKDPSIRTSGLAGDQDLDAISRHIPDNRQDGHVGARAVAAGTICLHLSRYLHSGDQDDIARLAFAAYAGVFAGGHDEPFPGSETWATSIPFDEVAAYEESVAGAPGVQVELRLQNDDLSFVEALAGPLEQRFAAVARRAFVGRPLMNV